MNGIDPSALGAKAAMLFFKRDAYLAAAIVYGETAKLAPDNPEVLVGLGAAVGNSAGVLVIAPFVQWSTRILKRCLAVSGSGPYAEVARQRLKELEGKKEYRDLPTLEPADLDELLAFLDIDRTIVVAAIDGIADDDKMFAVMALGDLRALRFTPVIAAAIEGRWGAAPIRSALKRVGPFAKRRSIHEAFAKLKASALAAEAQPYLEFAEKGLPPASEVEDDPVPAPPRRAAAAPAEVPPPPKPWWKIW